MIYSAAVPIQLSQVADTTSISTLLIRGGTLTTAQPGQFNGASGNANGYGRLILAGGGRIKISSFILNSSPEMPADDSSFPMTVAASSIPMVSTPASTGPWPLPPLTSAVCFKWIEFGYLPSWIVGDPMVSVHPPQSL